MGKKFEELEVLKSAEGLADSVWRRVAEWDGLAQETVGKQLVRAADSVGANIAESYGRFHFGERIQFLYYARGSLYETKYWLNRVYARDLMIRHDVQTTLVQIGLLARQLNAFLAYLKRQHHDQSPSTDAVLREPAPHYTTDPNPSVLFTDQDIADLTTLTPNEPTTNNQ